MTFDLSYEDRRTVCDAFGEVLAAGVYTEMAVDDGDAEGLAVAEAGLHEAERALETVCLRVGVEPEDAQRLYHQKAW
ncbi:hypothetical protein [Nocardiopsis synnemataformans]|uniref:hypothetical protein n=1 Tax=Nocardiopsis synnemataformans TaxID=61305 RepID=UPI003EBFC5E4